MGAYHMHMLPTIVNHIVLWRNNLVMQKFSLDLHSKQNNSTKSFFVSYFYFKPCYRKTSYICFIIRNNPPSQLGWDFTCCSQQLDNSLVDGGILLIVSPRVGILKAWRPQQYRESCNDTLATGVYMSSPWQRVLICRTVPAVKEPAEAHVANSFDTWLSSNGMRVLAFFKKLIATEIILPPCIFIRSQDQYTKVLRNPRINNKLIWINPIWPTIYEKWLYLCKRYNYFKSWKNLYWGFQGQGFI